MEPTVQSSCILTTGALSLRALLKETISVLYHGAGYIRARDPSRPVHYEGGGSQTPATDIVCPMYARIPQITRLADDPEVSLS